MRNIQIKPIPGTGYKYSIDNYGIVRRERPGKSSRPLQWQRDEKTRHPYVKILINENLVNKTIPTLIAMAFLPNPNPAKYTHAICKNMDPNDIRVENIEWVTFSYLIIKCKREDDGLKENYTSIYHGIYQKEEGWYIELTKNGYTYKQGPFEDEEEALDARFKLESVYPELTANI